MKNIYLLIFLLFHVVLSRAQVSDTSAAWAFMGGATTVGTNASVPTTAGGGFAAANRPRNRQYTHLWTDTRNRIWLFGGSGGVNAAIALNDLWVFDPAQGAVGEWRWVAGSGENGKHTGTLGQSSVANIPSARHQGITWKTSGDRLWIFGGQQVFGTSYTSAAYGNDLWRFDPATEEWTWVTGELPTAAGTLGTRTGSYPAQAGQEGTPRGRGWGVSTVDNSGNLWMYGGTTNGTGSGFMGDVWKFDVTAGKWFLMWGSATPDLQPDYNGQQTPGTPGGSPGGRHAAAFWSDAQGNVWVYGGHGSSHFFSDMWKFDITTLQWTWMSGSNRPSLMPPQNNNDGNGYWGDRGVPSTSRYPGKRYGMASFKDKQGRFWLHGGRAASGTGNALKNDMWMFDPQSLAWTWMEGDSVSDRHGVSGAVGVQDPSYKPSGRINMGLGAVDTAYNFWLFGGHGLGMTGNAAARNFLGDFWKLFPTTPPACTLTASVTASGPVSFCAGDSVLLKANNLTGVSYEWRNGATVLPVSVDSVWVKNSGVYTVTLTHQICNVTSSPVSVTVNQLPVVSVTPGTLQSVCPGDSLLLKASPVGMSYQWTRDGQPVGANADSLYVKAAGNYNVKVTNPSTGCADTLTARIPVSVNTRPTVTLNVSGTAAICTGDTLSVNVTSAQPGYSYQWYQNGQPVPGVGDRMHVYQQGHYNVRVTESVNGCHDTSGQGLSVTVHARPIVSVTPSGIVDVCQGDQIQLTATVTSVVQYQWKSQGAVTGGNGNTEMVSSSGHYYVVVTDANHCTDSSSATEVRVRTQPVFSVNPWNDTAFCTGGKVLYTIAGNDTALQYQWLRDGVSIPSATLNYYEASISGVYEAVVSWVSLSGCSDTSAAISVTVFPLPQPDIEYDGTELYSDPGHASYQWYFGAQPVGQGDRYTPAENGAYSVYVTDSNGCEGVSAVYNVNDIRTNISGTASPVLINIYPNPVAGTAVFFDYSSPVNYHLYSLEGKLLRHELKVHQADVSLLSDGVYVLRVTDEAGRLLKVERIIRYAR